eukprot:TRINITY_DN4146_c0_g3_i3.p1 TRINITY_DN4146_c0_g3~~TRINITY_DN4146_c0_g3_i3.p1  ORF type:complete len:334 (-),score=93.19 TRINITY_DN4146_c0_g3_i3:4-1005(-)
MQARSRATRIEEYATVKKPLFGYSESTDRRLKAKSKYMEDIREDLERLSNSLSPVVARQRTYATACTHKNIELEAKAAKHKLQAEYMEQLKMQIRLKEEARLRERDMERRAEKIEVKEVKQANPMLEKYKVDIRKDYEKYLSYLIHSNVGTKKERKEKQREELKKEDERVEKERKEISERYQEENRKEELKRERLRMAWKEFRDEYAKKQNEALAKRLNRRSPNIVDMPTVNRTTPTIIKTEEKQVSDNESAALENDLQTIIKGLNKTRKELINTNARIFGKLERIRASINRSVCIAVPLRIEKIPPSNESQELLQTTKFINIKPRICPSYLC